MGCCHSGGKPDQSAVINIWLEELWFDDIVHAETLIQKATEARKSVLPVGPKVLAYNGQNLLNGGGDHPDAIVGPTFFWFNERFSVSSRIKNPSIRFQIGDGKGGYQLDPFYFKEGLHFIKVYYTPPSAPPEPVGILRTLVYHTMPHFHIRELSYKTHPWTKMDHFTSLSMTLHDGSRFAFEHDLKDEKYEYGCSFSLTSYPGSASEAFKTTPISTARSPSWNRTFTWPRLTHQPRFAELSFSSQAGNLGICRIDLQSVTEWCATGSMGSNTSDSRSFPIVSYRNERFIKPVVQPNQSRELKDIGNVLLVDDYEDYNEFLISHVCPNQYSVKRMTLAECEVMFARKVRPDPFPDVIMVVLHDRTKRRKTTVAAPKEKKGKGHKEPVEMDNLSKTQVDPVQLCQGMHLSPALSSIPLLAIVEGEQDIQSGIFDDVIRPPLSSEEMRQKLHRYGLNMGLVRVSFKIDYTEMTEEESRAAKARMLTSAPVNIEMGEMKSSSSVPDEKGNQRDDFLKSNREDEEKKKADEKKIMEELEKEKQFKLWMEEQAAAGNKTTDEDTERMKRVLSGGRADDLIAIDERIAALKKQKDEQKSNVPLEKTNDQIEQEKKEKERVEQEKEEMLAKERERKREQMERDKKIREEARIRVISEQEEKKEEEKIVQIQGTKETVEKLWQKKAALALRKIKHKNQPVTASKTVAAKKVAEKLTLNVDIKRVVLNYPVPPHSKISFVVGVGSSVYESIKPIIVDENGLFPLQPLEFNEPINGLIVKFKEKKPAAEREKKKSSMLSQATVLSISFFCYSSDEEAWSAQDLIGQWICGQTLDARSPPDPNVVEAFWKSIERTASTPSLTVQPPSSAPPVINVMSDNDTDNNISSVSSISSSTATATGVTKVCKLFGPTKKETGSVEFIAALHGRESTEEAGQSAAAAEMFVLSDENQRQIEEKLRESEAKQKREVAIMSMLQRGSILTKHTFLPEHSTASVLLFYVSDTTGMSPGDLYWSTPNERIELSSRRMPLERVTDIVLGKVYGPVTANLPDVSKIISIVSDNGILNVEAPTIEEAQDWVDGLERVLSLTTEVTEEK